MYTIGSSRKLEYMQYNLYLLPISGTAILQVSTYDGTFMNHNLGVL